MNSYTKSYNFGYLSTDDRLKGNDSELRVNCPRKVELSLTKELKFDVCMFPLTSKQSNRSINMNYHTVLSQLPSLGTRLVWKTS